jgi:hypothetical protein
MNPRRDAATVPAAPEPEPEDILVRYARLGRERARRRGRYVLAGFVGITRPGGGQQQHQTAALLQQQVSAAMAGAGPLVEIGGTGEQDTRFDAFQQQQAVRQFVEQARRQIKQGGIR